MSDTARGPYPRLTPAAVELAKTRLGITNLKRLGEALGFTGRMTFYRLRHGEYDISYAQALHIADLIGLPLNEVFTGGQR